MQLSIIIPTLNEAESIMAILSALQTLRRQGHEVIIVDGGSMDNTMENVSGLADQILQCKAGRARQMNLGAQNASHEILLFLHADTLLAEHADDIVLDACKNHIWGRFDINISGQHFLLPIIAFFINLRSRLSSIATGDQAIFLYKETFEQVGGFPDQPLMEDIALCKKLRRLQRPACLKQRVTTSGRRWLQHGVVKTIVLMWLLRSAYFCGVKPHRLARFY